MTQQQQASLSAYYSTDKNQFYVVEVGWQVVGGGGFEALEGEDGVGEMRKGAIIPSARNKGIFRTLLITVLGEMQKAGYKISYLQV